MPPQRMTRSKTPRATWVARVAMVVAVVAGLGAGTAISDVITRSDDGRLHNANRVPPPGSTQDATPAPAFGMRNPTELAHLLFQAWNTNDRPTAATLATEAALTTLFQGDAGRGWTRPDCALRGTGLVCRLTRGDAVGPMVWTIEGSGSGLYALSSVSVPPIPLDVKHLPPTAWAVFVSIGPSSYSQLATAVRELHDLGLGDDRISEQQLTCYPGVASELQAPPGYVGVVAFFASKAQAEALAGMLATPAEAVERTRALCG
jgi:hypothetical protein